MSRKKRKEREFKTRFQENNYLKIIKGGQVETITRQQSVNIVPRNFKQDDLIAALENDNTNIVFTTGPAGTGKTLLSTLYALREFKNKTYSKIVITRPAVSVDEQHGFLPGTLVEKMAPMKSQMQTNATAINNINNSNTTNAVGGKRGVLNGEIIQKALPYLLRTTN